MLINNISDDKIKKGQNAQGLFKQFWNIINFCWETIISEMALK